MANVLVTGGTGFIGRHLVEGLVRRGDRVRCLFRPDSQIEPLRLLGVELSPGDVDNRAALKKAATGVELVYHVAGIVRAYRSRDFYDVNQQGTANLVEACAAQPRPPRVVLVSSIAAAGPTPRGQIRMEADPPMPVSNYGRSKLGAEQAMARVAGTVSATVVRPGIVFGPRDTGFIQVMRSIRMLRCHFSPGFHPPPLSMIHISDLVELMLSVADRGRAIPAVENGQPGAGRYYAVAAEHPTYAELGRLVRPMLRRKRAPVVPIPGPLLYCVGGINEVIGRWRGRAEELCIDKVRDALAPSWACSGEAAKRDLGFVPAKPLAERLQETVEWCLANRCL